jgi:hypothetical protein
LVSGYNGNCRHIEGMKATYDRLDFARSDGNLDWKGRPRHFIAGRTAGGSGAGRTVHAAGEIW